MSVTDLSKYTNKEDKTTSRELPHNIEAEQYVLGHLLVKNSYLDKFADYLSHEHFFVPVHARIFEKIAAFYNKGMLATPVTLKTYFEDDEALESYGGSDYLLRLAAMAIDIIDVAQYAKLIFDLYQKRTLIDIGEAIVNNTYDKQGLDDTNTLITKAEGELYSLATKGSGDKGFEHLKSAMAISLERAEKAMKTAGNVTGIPTSFKALDNLMAGLQDSDLIILAARPSMGKTALACNIALKAAKWLKNEPRGDEKPRSVGIFSLEMASDQLASRLISGESGIDSNKMRKGELSDEDFTQLVKANTTLSQVPLFLDDTPGLSIAALRAKAKRLKRKENLGLVVIDYLQLLQGSKSTSQQSRVLEITEITQGLKAMAKELSVPVIALSQLSRAVENRKDGDKRPQLSDLRESGSIEQDADVVLFIYREEYYVSRQEPSDKNSEEYEKWYNKMEECRNLTEIIIAKQRNGPIGNVHLQFSHNKGTFNDYEPDGDKFRD